MIANISAINQVSSHDSLWKRHIVLTVFIVIVSQQKFKRSLSRYGVFNVQLTRGFSEDEYGEIDLEFVKTMPPIHITVPNTRKKTMKTSLSRYDRFLDAAVSTNTIDSSDEDEGHDTVVPFLEENDNNSLRAQRKKFTSRYEIFQQQNKATTQNEALKQLLEDDEEYGEIVPDIVSTNLTLPSKTVKDKQIMKKLVSRYSHFEDAPINVEHRDSDDEDYGKLEEEIDTTSEKPFSSAIPLSIPSLRVNIVTAVRTSPSITYYVFFTLHWQEEIETRYRDPIFVDVRSVSNTFSSLFIRGR